MKYGLIGCGRIANNHIKAAVANGIEIVALCDVSNEAIEELVNKHDIKNVKKYNDYKEMIEQNEFDFVAIATSSGWHAQIAKDCIKKHINIVIEKPIAMSIKDAREIIELSKEHDVKVGVCHQNRFNIAIQEMRKAVEAERLGKISHGSISVRWNRGKAYYDQAKWRGTWKCDGGSLMNQSIHGFDLLLWMMGSKPKRVFGCTRRQFHDYLETEDLGVAIVEFENGSVATVEGTTNIYPKNLEETLYIFGNKGTIKIGGTSANEIEVWNLEETEDTDKAGFVEHVENVYGNGHTSLYADVISAIKENRQPYVDAEAGKNALELILAIYKSQKTGMPVELPLQDFSTLEMTGEFDS